MPSSPVPGASPEYTRAFRLRIFFLVGFNLRSWYWIRKARGFRAGYGAVA